MPRGKRTIAGGFLLGLTLGTACAEVVVVVSVESPVRSLTRAELTDIYLGRMNSLPNNGSLVPVDQWEKSPAHDEFYDRYLGRSPAQIRALWSKLIFSGRGQPPRAVTGDKDVAEFVAGNRNAIGYLSPDRVDKRLRVVPIE